jgi:hypothetical protein
VQTTLSGTIYLASTTSPKYKTENGVHVGSQQSDVRAAFGSPSREVPRENWIYVIYDTQGIMFYVRNGKVFQISVFQPYRS